MGKLRDFFKKEEEKEIRYILTIDGGGMRGIIPAHILAYLDSLIKEEGDARPLYSHFDLISGTSTGALLALALSAPSDETPLEREIGEDVPVTETVKKGFFRKPQTNNLGYIHMEADPRAFKNIYLDNGRRIFPGTRKGVLGQIFNEKYDSKPLESFLVGTFADQEFSTLRVPTLIVSFNTLTSDTYLFKSWDSHQFLTREVARATTAAPTYFSPSCLIDRETGEHLILIDGGMIANNPIVLAYAEAKKLYPDADEYRILSLSTCRNPYEFDATKVNGGFSGWMTSITKIYSSAQDRMMELSSDLMHDASTTRIWSKVMEKKIHLDDTTRESLEILLKGAETCASEHDEELHAWAHELASVKTPDHLRLDPWLMLPESTEPNTTEEN